jgi:hypothetical protein
MSIEYTFLESGGLAPLEVETLANRVSKYKS